MIRPFTCVCVLLAGGSGLYLYQSKHRAQLLDREIENTVARPQAARERTGVLRAEWTLLNDPERLAQLAGRFLSLKTVTPGQFTTLAELDNRLPRVRCRTRRRRRSAEESRGTDRPGPEVRAQDADRGGSCCQAGTGKRGGEARRRSRPP